MKIRNKKTGEIIEVTEDQLTDYGLTPMAKGGMIKRADGSYSRRGLWDNIRANKGSGKKPTKAMLKQEKKIRAAEKAYGGYMADGGINNPGFRALPSYVQEKIKANMNYGGYMASGGCMECGGKMQEGGKTKKLTPKELKWLATSLRGLESANRLSGRYADNTMPGLDRERLKWLENDQKLQLQDYMKNTGPITDILEGLTPNIPFFNPKPVGSKLEDGGKLPKEILKARLESHMSSDQAKKYLNKYQKGGKAKSKKALDEAMNEIASDFNRRLEKNAINNAIDSMYGPPPQMPNPAFTNLPYYPDPNTSLNELLTPLPYRPNLNESMEEMMTPYAEGGYLDQAGDGKWIQKAINPKHKGYCTPMTKSTCTPRRKALARTLKKMAKSRKEEGGYVEGQQYEMSDAEINRLRSMGYKIKEV